VVDEGAEVTAVRVVVAVVSAVALFGGAWLAGVGNGRRVMAAARPGFDQGLSGPMFVVGAALFVVGAGGFAWAVLG
jgi:hypothetical protein